MVLLKVRQHFVQEHVVEVGWKLRWFWQFIVRSLVFELVIIDKHLGDL